MNFLKYYVQELSIEKTWLDGEKRANQLLNLLKSFDVSVLAIVSHANFIRNIMALSSNFDPNNSSFKDFDPNNSSFKDFDPNNSSFKDFDSKDLQNCKAHIINLQ